MEGFGCTSTRTAQAHGRNVGQRLYGADQGSQGNFGHVRVRHDKLAHGWTRRVGGEADGLGNNSARIGHKLDRTCSNIGRL
eukprot:12911241-Prorocentrum_lima.AAC.1